MQVIAIVTATLTVLGTLTTSLAATIGAAISTTTRDIAATMKTTTTTGTRRTGSTTSKRRTQKRRLDVFFPLLPFQPGLVHHDVRTECPPLLLDTVLHLSVLSLLFPLPEEEDEEEHGEGEASLATAQPTAGRYGDRLPRPSTILAAITDFLCFHSFSFQPTPPSFTRCNTRRPWTWGDSP